MGAVAQDKITSAMVKAALRKRFCAPEWAIMFEVGDATGARHTRFADAVAMSLWPSRGLELHGIENKVARSDWLNERKQPEKAETIARFCEHWHLVTAQRVVLDVSEIPPAWGWIEFDGAKFHERKKPVRTAAEPITRAFLAALLRRVSSADAAEVDALVAKRCADAEAQINERIDRELSFRSRDYEALKASVAEFEKASGFTIDTRQWGGGNEELGRAVAAVKRSGVCASYSGLKQLRFAMSNALERLDAGLALFGDEPGADDARAG
jgi:hypothetical protein